MWQQVEQLIKAGFGLNSETIYDTIDIGHMPTLMLCGLWQLTVIVVEKLQTGSQEALSCLVEEKKELPVVFIGEHEDS